MTGRIVRFPALACAMFAIAGCQHTSPNNGAPGGEGLYEFMQFVGAQKLSGTMRVAADTIVVRAAETDCVPVVDLLQREFLRFACRGVATLNIHRLRPTTHSTWEGGQAARSARTRVSSELGHTGRETGPLRFKRLKSPGSR